MNLSSSRGPGMARSSDPGVQLCKDIPREANCHGFRVRLRANENAREKRLAKLDRAVARLGISNGASPPTGACAAGARRCRGETFPPHKPLKNHES